MEVGEIFNRTIQRSGQYLLRTNNIEINIDAFRILVEDALAIYSKACPYDVVEQISMVYPRNHEFGLDGERIPDWIATATPIFGQAGAFYQTVTPNRGQYNNSSAPVEALWKYSKPKLTVNISSEWDVTCVYKHRVTKLPIILGEPVGYEVKTIDIDDNVFFDILRGMFLRGIGMSRRAFTLNDLPIAMDADQLVSDGETLFEKASTTDLENVQKIHLF